MSAVFADRSSDTNRANRNVTRTGTTAAEDNFYKARPAWQDGTTAGDLLPPKDGTVTTWADA